ncbi:MAG: hypothetical protein M3065_05900 [Actinomycetota bacterium]|nr:hypothetical protein [Actinomycetota bacterium]
MGRQVPGSLIAMAIVLEVTPQPTGPELPEPSGPIDPGPVQPDVPSPDPRGPETPDQPIEPDPPLPSQPAEAFLSPRGMRSWKHRRRAHCAPLSRSR